PSLRSTPTGWVTSVVPSSRKCSSGRRSSSTPPPGAGTATNGTQLSGTGVISRYTMAASARSPGTVWRNDTPATCRLRLTGRPSAPCTTRSTPHTRLAISSRSNATSSSGSLSSTWGTTGGRARTSETNVCSPGWPRPNVDQPSPRAEPAITDVPNVSITSNWCTQYTEPAASSTGSTNQSTP